MSTSTDPEANDEKATTAMTPAKSRRTNTKSRRAKRRKLTKRSHIWIFTALALAFAVACSLFVWHKMHSFTEIRTSEGVALLQKETVERAEITDGLQRVRLWLTEPTTHVDDKGTSHKAGTKVEFQYVAPEGEKIAGLVAEAKTRLGYNSRAPEESVWSSIVVMAVPLLLIMAFLLYFMPRMQSGAAGLPRLRNRASGGEKPDVTFADVAGEDEAVAELREIKEFLTDPERFHALGAKIPRGVLLYGPPGTGKTLLARAVAGEAGVPFFSISASEFVEMYVGVGASRVRKLFDQAKQNAPAIVFVDEIDAVGRGRGAGIGGGNDEREQTLNQLLVELDGFDDRANVILIAATNRPDVLDAALLRPGRFDRHIAVDAPDLAGRLAILKVHACNKPLEEGMDLEVIARRTPGFTGADLHNVLNEAALLAARDGEPTLSLTHVDEAIDRVLAGPQRQSRVMNEEDRRMTAYHEAGHALAAAALHHCDPVTKVTILPRGKALGYTMVMPTEDRYSTSRSKLLDELTYAMGGRAAEELVFADPSTGASNDIQKATQTARKMVGEFGMSSVVGPVRLESEEEDPFTRARPLASSPTSPQLAGRVDEEVRTLLDAAFAEAWHILVSNREVLDHLASLLLEKETVLESELEKVFAPVRKAPKRERWMLAPSVQGETAGSLARKENTDE